MRKYSGHIASECTLKPPIYDICTWNKRYDIFLIEWWLLFDTKCLRLYVAYTYQRKPFLLLFLSCSVFSYISVLNHVITHVCYHFNDWCFASSIMIAWYDTLNAAFIFYDHHHEIFSSFFLFLWINFLLHTHTNTHTSLLLWLLLIFIVLMHS